MYLQLKLQTLYSLFLSPILCLAVVEDDFRTRFSMTSRSPDRTFHAVTCPSPDRIDFRLPTPGRLPELESDFTQVRTPIGSTDTYRQLVVRTPLLLLLPLS